MLITAVAIVVLATGLWVGLPGILSGSRVMARRGGEHLMHYPVGVPWFRGKVNTARWVVRTGRLFAGGALLLTTLMLSVAWWPSDDGQNRSACERLAPLTQIGSVAGTEVTYGDVVKNDHRCELEIRTLTEQDQFLQIEVDAPQALIGASLESQRRELERRSMTLRPLPTLGSEAVVALQPNQADGGAIFLFTDGGATVRVQTTSATPSQVKLLARVFAQHRTDGG